MIRGNKILKKIDKQFGREYTDDILSKRKYYLERENLYRRRDEDYPVYNITKKAVKGAYKLGKKTASGICNSGKAYVSKKRSSKNIE